jgi:hypothetical protein
VIDPSLPRSEHAAAQDTPVHAATGATHDGGGNDWAAAEDAEHAAHLGVAV